MTRHKLLAALAINVGFVLGGCFGESAIGPCSLRVAKLDQNGQGSTALTPPYRVGRTERVVVSGNGWTQMNVELHSPSRAVTSDQFTWQMVRARDDSVIAFTSPGQWQVRLSDPVSRCVREFAVEAVQ